ncbi:MAG: MoxR family ATPase [Gammaproteobacteria bacterium]|nr:MoxR family ATPase [Gammaproteobacteria bacterium]
MRELSERIGRRLVGRHREVMVILAALQTGRNLFLEGPPGTSKSTILKAVVEELGRPFYWVTGNSDLTATKLLGYFDPALILSKGYRPEDFEYGALTLAMKEGGILYVEEFNRLPDDTSNAFVTAMSERAIPVPRLGTVRAQPEFGIVASLNPYDDVGTLRISRALRDRFCSLWMDYQSKDEEKEIVSRQIAGMPVPAWLDVPALIDVAVESCRRTRTHEDVHLGASVRGAIDMTLVAMQLLANHKGGAGMENRSGLIRMAAHAALRDKIRLNDVSERRADDVIDDIWTALAAELPMDANEFWQVGLRDGVKKKPEEMRLTY